jgi:hypothetical protein
MYKTAWNYRTGTIIYDDSDGVFQDLTRLNLLKAMCDTKPVRRISWVKESAALVDEAGEPIPQSFEFEGRVIFLSNVNFHKEIAKNGPRSQHLAAIRDRSGLLDMGLNSKRRRVLKVVHVARHGNLMENAGITDPELKEKVINFFLEHQEDWTQISMRTMTLLATDAAANPWDRFVRQAAFMYMKKGALSKMLKSKKDEETASEEPAA